MLEVAQRLELLLSGIRESLLKIELFDRLDRPPYDMLGCGKWARQGDRSLVAGLDLVESPLAG